MRRKALTLFAALFAPPLLLAQAPTPADSPRYDVVSIKRHDQLEASGGMRTLPDGTFVMTNQSIRSILAGAAPVPVRDVIG